MPTDSAPKDLDPTIVPDPPSASDLENTNETPAEVDPVGTKEADAVAQGPDIAIGATTEDSSGETKEEDRGPENQPSPEPTPPTEPEPEQPRVGVGTDADGAVDSAPSDGTVEPGPIAPEPDHLDDQPGNGATDGPAAPTDQPSDSDGSASHGQADGEPEVLTPEVEMPAEDPKGPPSSDEVEAIDAEFEPVEADPKPLPEEDTEPDAQPEGPYTGFHAEKEHMAGALGQGGVSELLAAANRSFALVDLLRRVSEQAEEAERQEAQFLLGIGALWLAQLERWLARR